MSLQPASTHQSRTNHIHARLVEREVVSIMTREAFTKLPGRTCAKLHVDDKRGPAKQVCAGILENIS